MIIPAHVKDIGMYAFFKCNLTEIHIPKSVTSIGHSAFAGTNMLKQITVDPENPIYSSSNNCIIEKASKTLIVGCATSCIPFDGSVTSIANYAFYMCEELQSIIIPQSVQHIVPSAFAGCINLKDVYYTGTSYDWSFSKDTFPYATIHCHDVIFHSNGDGTCYVSKAFSSDGCCWYIDDLYLLPINPNGDVVTKIGDGAFSTNNPYNKLRHISIPNTVTDIGNSAFFMSGLQTVSIPEDSALTYIGAGAFQYCSIESIYLPPSVTSIGDHAFSSTYLKTIDIPDNVTIIEPWTFGFCGGLTSVNWSQNSRLTTIGEMAFADSGLNNITLPSRLTRIENYAFEGCFDLTDVYYLGTEEQWNEIVIEDGNDPLLNATIHFLGGPVKENVFFNPTSGLCVGDTGKLVHGIAVCLDSETRYCHAGKPQRKGAATDPDGYIYYFNSALKAVRNTTYTIGESMANGIIPAGTYNVDAQGRLMDGRGELLRADTAMTDGFKYFADGTIRYYVDGKPARAGLVTDEEGNYYYFNSSLKAVRGTWYEIGESMTNGHLPAGRYYFNGNGTLILS
jgi:hypothetical protein